MILPGPIFVDGDFTVPVAVSAPSFSSPFQGVKDAWQFTQDWMQFELYFSPTALGTPHPDTDNTGHTPTTGPAVAIQLSSYILVSESERVPVGGGVVKWTRTYAKTPASRSEWSNITYNFIGFFGVSGVNVAYVQGRNRKVMTVPCKIVYDYWLTGAASTVDNSGTGAASTAVSPDLIPQIQEQKYFFEAYTGAPPAWSTDWTLGNATDFIGDTTGANVTIANPTSPSRSTYQGWMTAKTFTLVPEPSQIARWLGPIFQRTTKFIQAQ